MTEKWWIGNDDRDPLDPPEREKEHEHQCVCDLVSVQIADGNPYTSHDRCHQSVFSPDQPFCDDCEKAGHPDLTQFKREG